ncbi:MAG: SDR family oxidoreductase [Potamolinea sp.]
MNITIIGCGYVGTALAEYWHQKQSHLITATTTTNERVEELEKVADKVVVMKGDDATAMQSVVQNQDVVLVSVAPISDRQVSAEGYAETYLPTAKNLIAALSNAPTAKQIIYLSSCSVYGNRNGEWVDETVTIEPPDKLGQVLAQTEQILLSAKSEDVKVSILRMGGIYGPERELGKRFIRIAGKTLPGTGESFMNWIHLDDIVCAVDFVLVNQCGGIYNLVNDVTMRIRDLCDQICDRENLPKVLWNPSEPSQRDFNTRVSNQKLKAAGYKFIHPDKMI